jgi:hypothetical protein
MLRLVLPQAALDLRHACYSVRTHKQSAGQPESPKIPAMADLTIDQELDLLEDAFRRLKVEYDIYFAGSSKRSPEENEIRVRAQIRRHLENSRLNMQQRYRLNTLAQRYAVFAELWRRKVRVKDEGYRRPEDKLLGVGGFGHLEEAPAGTAANGPQQSFVLQSTEVLDLMPLYEAVVQARESVGQPLGSFDSFASFVRNKTASIRHQFQCQAVEYTVTVKSGQVSLKARPRKGG